eukprot:TRINITY_DN1351_c0_g1_i4.p1 TRINITY_DN1351_c0_g1~~TRINITY_DN1351_c0_g1_i4.p1  ORF type:complete len:232 (+),score=46.74 TRINITY_DN1351_c0_g1_i4:484-1179(+)
MEAIAHAVCKYVPLRFSGQPRSSGEYKLDLEEVERAITTKTKLIVVNNPQNVPGKVYSLQELDAIATLAKKHNLYVLADEVYEAMTYDGIQHTRMASLPGMWNRTITLGSAGKSFSVTGWKTGWAIAPPEIASALWTMHQNTTFCSNAPMQEAIAVGFERIMDLEPDYFDKFRAEFEGRRNRLCAILDKVHLRPIVPQGSYFVLADFTAIPESVYLDPSDSATKDHQFCRW